jgi:predicted transcriptional regulator
MNLIQIADILDAELMCGPGGWEQIRIDSVFASDLMSDVLMSDRDSMLLITSLSTEQSIRSAGIVGSEAVVIANSKTVTDGMIELAREQDIALLCTPFPKYESCVRIGRIMEP